MKLDDLKKLHQKKYRSQLGYYLIEGEHLVLEWHKAAKISKNVSDITLYICAEHVNWAGKLHPQVNTVVLSAKQMAQISDTKTPQGIVACVPMPALNAAPQNIHPQPTSIYLHEVQDPGNLGTILRSLAWFGNFRLLLSPNSVDPFNPKVVRASMGAIFHVPIELDVSLDSLSQRFKRFAYLDLQGKALSDASFNDYECYLFGNEARGVPHDSLAELAANPFTIAGSGNIDSLNLASAVTICAYRLSAS